MADADAKEEANRLIAYHGPISRALTAERTSLESRLIPVSAYIIVACAEAWYRYPEMMAAIDAALPAEEVGRAGRRPGSRINTVHLWSIANFWLLGRKIMGAFVPEDDPERAATVLRFWEQAALGFRGDSHRQAWDAGGVIRAYDDDLVAALREGVAEVDDDRRAAIKRFNATLVAHLFLLYFDTRVGSGDTGPWRLEDGRTLLVRDSYKLGHSPDFWWSDVAADVPYQNLTAALVLDGVDVRITDFGTANTTPEDHLDHLAGFALYTTDGGSLRAVPLDELDGIVGAVRSAQAAHYRNLVAMTDNEKIRCGASVYFTFLRPFAEAAGVADELDWTVPRDLPEPLYELFCSFRGGAGDAPLDDPYYALIA